MRRVSRDRVWSLLLRILAGVLDFVFAFVASFILSLLLMSLVLYLLLYLSLLPPMYPGFIGIATLGFALVLIIAYFILLGRTGGTVFQRLFRLKRRKNFRGFSGK